MPLARIRTRFPERVSDVAATLLAAGYTVETAHPDEFKNRQAEVELWIDDPPMAQAWCGRPEDQVSVAVSPAPVAGSRGRPMLLNWLTRSGQRLKRAGESMRVALMSRRHRRHGVLAGSKEPVRLDSNSVPVESAVVVEEIMALPPAVPAPGGAPEVEGAFAHPLTDTARETMAVRPETSGRWVVVLRQHGAAICKSAVSGCRTMTVAGRAGIAAARQRVQKLGIPSRVSRAAHVVAMVFLTGVTSAASTIRRGAGDVAHRRWTRRELQWVASGMVAGILAIGFALGWNVANHRRMSNPRATVSAAETKASTVAPADPLRIAARPAIAAAVDRATTPKFDAAKRRVRHTEPDDSDDVVVIHYPMRPPARRVQRAGNSIPHYSDLQ